jgi:predicted anti-sigma-YlaC factor YlaD
MAAFDGEATPEAEAAYPEAHQHLASCAACVDWMRSLDRVDGQLKSLAYPAAPADLWTMVEPRLRQPRTMSGVTRRLGILGAVVLGWRTLQLSIELPFPAVHPLVPLASAIAALWLIARDPFAIETFAPELRKGRV